MTERSSSGIFKEIKDAIEENIDARIELLQLEATDRTARLVGAMTYGIIAGVLLVFVLLFLSLVAGFYFTELTGSTLKGFGIVAVIYVLLVVLLMVFRKKFINLVTNSIVDNVFENISDED